MFFFFQAEDGIRDAQESRGLGDVYKRQVQLLLAPYKAPAQRAPCATPTPRMKPDQKAARLRRRTGETETDIRKEKRARTMPGPL